MYDSFGKWCLVSPLCVHFSNCRLYQDWAVNPMPNPFELPLATSRGCRGCFLLPTCNKNRNSLLSVCKVLNFQDTEQWFSA